MQHSLAERERVQHDVLFLDVCDADGSSSSVIEVLEGRLQLTPVEDSSMHRVRLSQSVTRVRRPDSD